MTGSAPLRISLGGGGTDLPSYYLRHGGLVVSLTIDKRIHCTLEPDGDFSHSEPLNPYPAAVVDWLGLRGLRPAVHSEVAHGTGLGSSGCLLVALVGTALAYLGRRADPRRLAELAYYLETHRLRRRVGKQDHYAAAHGGLRVYRFARRRVDVVPLTVPPQVRRAIEERIVLFSTNIRRDSETILRRQDGACRSRRTETVAALGGRMRLAERMVAAVRAGDMDGIGALLRRDWEFKRAMVPGISSTAIDRAHDTAVQAGARGGRILGAGGGGHLLIWAEPSRRKAVVSALESLGLTHVPVGLDPRGFTLGGGRP